MDEVARHVAAELGVGCEIEVASQADDAAARDDAPGGDAERPGRLVVRIAPSGAGGPSGYLALTSSDGVDADHGAFARELGRRVALALENAGLLETTRQAVAIRDRFLSMASHELRTPLTSLQLQGESMRRRIGRGEAFSHEQSERLVSMLLRQVQRLRRLVETC